MRPLGLYIHWPFCRKVCPYCDFTVAKVRDVEPSLWLEAFSADLQRLTALVEQRPLTSIYFGGGTPGLMPLSVMEGLLNEASRLFGFKPDIEITLEANPDNHARFTDFASAGVNRLSLGVQSFDDDELIFLGRNHNGAQAQTAVDKARSAFDRVSFDLIYALPDQTLRQWRHHLFTALLMEADHLSLYQLTIEPSTAFGRAAQRGQLLPLSDDRSADFYALTQDMTARAGLPAYEVSNHARPGYEAVHNHLYWDDADWLAIGPGAHGRLGTASERYATEGASSPTRYAALPMEKRISISQLTLEQHRLEVLSSGLRPVSGLALDRLGDDAGRVQQIARSYADQGLLTIADDRLAVTEQGRLVLDHLTALLAEGVTSSVPSSA